MLEKTFPKRSKPMPEMGIKIMINQFTERVPMTWWGTETKLKNVPGPVLAAVNFRQHVSIPVAQKNSPYTPLQLLT